MGLPVYNRAGRRMSQEEIKQEEELFMAVEPIFLAPRRCLVGEEFCGPDLLDDSPEIYHQIQTSSPALPSTAASK